MNLHWCLTLPAERILLQWLKSCANTSLYPLYMACSEETVVERWLTPATGALCQTYRNDLWTEVHAHPKEQVIVGDSFLFLPKLVFKGGWEKVMPNCWLSHVLEMLNSDGAEDLADFLSISTKCWPMHQHCHKVGNDGCQQKVLEQVISPVEQGIRLKL